MHHNWKHCPRAHSALFDFVVEKNAWQNRTDRLKSIEHEIRLLENLKTLAPNTTPEEPHALSNALINLASAAFALESGQPARLERLQQLYDRVDELPKLVKW